MADENFKHSNADPQYDETTAPQNPPQSMVRPKRRTVWLASSLGTLAAIFLVVAAAFLIMTARRALQPGPQVTPDPTAVGTSGERQPREDTPGGFNPTPPPGNTAAELKFKGEDLVNRLQDVGSQPAGQRVELRDVKVERADGDVFWVRDGDATVAVVSAGGAPTVKAGQSVNVSGTIERNGSAARIRASRIEVR